LSLDDEALAKLLLSIGTRKKWRYYDPIETAKSIDKLSKKYSRKEISKILGVSTEMIREFLNLLTLSDKIQIKIKNREIGIDMGYRISLLKDKREQEVLLSAIIKNNITSDEVKGIIQSLNKNNPNMSMEDIIDIALKYRPIIEEEQIIITKFKKETLDQLLNISKLENINPSIIIKNILGKEFKNSEYILSANLHGQTLIIALKNEGYDILKDKSNKTKININYIIDELISKGLDKYESYK